MSANARTWNRPAKETKKMMMTEKLKRQLCRCACKYETPDFVDGDPSRFMHKLRKENMGDANREATAFVASCLSFGSIPQFIPKIEKLVNLSAGDMDGWIRRGGFRSCVSSADCCFYRYVTNHDLFAFLSAYEMLMKRHGTLGGYVRAAGDGTGLGAVRAICTAFRDSGSRHLVPADATSACKRICMFLRWMVRTGSPVDIGLWSGFIDRKTLIIPLDTHVVQEAQALGLLPSGASATMSTARKLTAIMAEVFPDDPARGDFALYGRNLDAST